MTSLHFSVLTNNVSNNTINEMLEEFDPFIVALARKNAPRSVAHPDLFSDVVDELAQKPRIKLWQATQRQHIVNPKPYIRCIIRTESIDMIRSCTPDLPLPADEDGELYQGKLLISLSEGMDDPACELEHSEVASELLEAVADALLALPPRQNFAMTCSLLERVSEVHHLTMALKKRKVNIEKARWPYDEVDTHRLKASVATARRKVAQHMAINVSDCKKKKVPKAHHP